MPRSGNKAGASRRAEIAALPWDKIELEVSRGIPFADLARQYGIPQGTIRARAWRENWAGKARDRAIKRAMRDGHYADGPPGASTAGLPVKIVVGPALPPPPPSVLEKQTDRSVLEKQTDRSVATSLSEEDSSIAIQLCNHYDPFVARLAGLLLDGAVVAKPRTVGELATLQGILHKAAKGWRASDSGGPGTGIRRAARVPGRVIDA